MFLLPEIIFLVLTKTLSLMFHALYSEGNNRKSRTGTGLYGSRVKASNPKTTTTNSSRLIKPEHIIPFP